MVAKELWDSWWKLAAVGVLAVGSLVLSDLPTPYVEIEWVANENARPHIDSVVLNGTDQADGNTMTPAVREELRKAAEAMHLPTDPVGMALDELWIIYGAGGGAAMALLAGLLGVGLVSEETRRSTIFALLSRPISRRRLLLEKYAVCAGILLLAAVSGGIVLVVAAGIQDYPLQELDVVGSVFSAVLLWVGSLFVLGVALIFSVLVRNVLVGVAATLAALILFSPDQWTSFSFWNLFPTLPLWDGTPENLTLFGYWGSKSMFIGDGLAPTNFLVCVAAAVLPLLAALWLFRRRAY